MSKFNRNIKIASTALAVGALMTGSMAIAQTTDTAKPATDTYKSQATEHSQSMMGHDSAKADKLKSDAQQLTSAFGVSELNDIEDWKVVNNGEELGEIDRLGVDRNTGELLAIVGLEGVVGVNMKEVAIPLKDLKKSADESLSTTLTKEQLQSKRDIDPWDGSYSQIVGDKIDQ
jgi:PRC-barrel domain